MSCTNGFLPISKLEIESMGVGKLFFERGLTICSAQGMYLPTIMLSTCTLCCTFVFAHFCHGKLIGHFQITFGFFFQSESCCSSFHMKVSFHSHAIENLLSYEGLSTRTRFENEAKGNLEIVHC